MGMNARQAAKEASKRIEELERVNRLYAADVRDYNACISHMINHGSPCDYCEDRPECLSDGKDVQTGCDDWMLRSQEVGNDQ